jgi:hypothetical protein
MTVTPFPTPKPDWLKQCILGDGKNPKPLAIVANALIALRNDPAVRDALAYDGMLCAPMLMHEIGQPLMGNVPSPRPLTDQDIVDVQEWMQEVGLKRMARETVCDAIAVYARDNSYHPVKAYLESVKWMARNASTFGSLRSSAPREHRTRKQSGRCSLSRWSRASSDRVASAITCLCSKVRKARSRAPPAIFSR